MRRENRSKQDVVLGKAETISLW